MQGREATRDRVMGTVVSQRGETCDDDGSEVSGGFCGDSVLPLHLAVRARGVSLCRGL